ncbi:hypothetical protein SETIT_1G313200v2 [Setaria italica]|uniref:Uncharacterized protein n=1 Tax=Setaria italica TaxID=4555 RepID=A0A368PRK8_SETIT|nr:hypothetical protein SETIT_1G313200v2 [Setaria italica]
MAGPATAVSNGGTALSPAPLESVCGPSDGRSCRRSDSRKKKRISPSARPSPSTAPPSGHRRRLPTAAMPRSLYDVPPVVLHPPSPSCSAPPLPASSFSSSPSALPTHGCRSRSVLASCLPLSLSRSAIGMAPAGHATLLLRQQWIPVNSIR